VLIEGRGREALTSLLPPGADRVDVSVRWLECEVVRAFERGRIDSAEFASRLVREWALELDPEAFIAQFARWPGDFFPGAKDLVRDLRRRHRVACFSNSNAVHWARFPDLSGLFDATFSSHLIGHVKPDREGFEHVLGELDVHPREVCFLDDLQPNVDSALALGMRAHRVEGVAGVVAALEREGLR